MNEATKGLCNRVSEKYAALGARMLGRLNRTNRGLPSSLEIGALGDAIELDDGGKAKSVEDVGSDGRTDDLGMFSARSKREREGRKSRHEEIQVTDNSGALPHVVPNKNRGPRRGGSRPVS